MTLFRTTILYFALISSCFAATLVQPDKVHAESLKTSQPQKFDANGFLIFENAQYISLSENEAKKISAGHFSVHARVRVDQPKRWGGLVSYSQDNGSYERGWILGYQNNRFNFKFSDGGKFAAVTAPQPFILGATYNITATYDGKIAKLFINGVEVAQRKTNKNTISQPDIPTPFVIGAYKDKDEFFPLKGRIELVKINSKVSTAAEIRTLSKESNYQFSVRPSVSFLVAGEAQVEWESTHAGNSMINYGNSPKLGSIIHSKSTTTSHKVILKNLKPSTLYHYRIGVQHNGKRLLAAPMSFDTTMNYLPIAVPALPSWLPAKKARILVDELVKNSGKHSAGHALIIGAVDAKLAYEIARRTNLKVTLIDRDKKRIDLIRENLYPLGIYGTRIEAIHVPDDSIPLNSASANFIFSERTLVGEPLPYPVSEFKRLTRPAGGIINTTPLKFIRPALPNSDEWTHQYGDSENRAYTNDSLAGAHTQTDFTLQWLGRPGADFGIDRQNRIPSPLAVSGRTFLQGLNRMIGLDAYNGQILWSKEIPDLRRMNVPHDCSNWCADKENIYLAIADRAWIIDAASGKRLSTLKLTKQHRDSHDWGYIAVNKDVIVGSAVPKGAQFTDFWGGDKWYDQVGNKDAITQICSDKIFGYRKTTNRGLWAYGNGLIVNSTITLSNNALYFLECRQPDLKTQGLGKVKDNKLWFQSFIVCLNPKTGKKIWEKPLPPFKYLTKTHGFIQAIHGQLSDVGYLLVASEGILDSKQKFKGRGHFVAHQFDRNGSIKWSINSPWQTNHHGAHIVHPVVFPNKVFLHPFAYNIKDGTKINTRLTDLNGCPTLVGYPSGIIYRSTGSGASRVLCLWSLENQKNTGWKRLRPSCWLNYQPAQGMIIMSEGGGGCSCGGWMETSVSFIPLKHTK